MSKSRAEAEIEEALVAARRAAELAQRAAELTQLRSDLTDTRVACARLLADNIRLMQQVEALLWSLTRAHQYYVVKAPKEAS